jgi:HEAT repeat protein
MKPTLALAIFAVLMAGCSQGPPLSGGKPVEHGVNALQASDAKVRKRAVCKLGNAGAPEAEAWAAVVAALRDRDAGVRQEAILALMKCGPRAQETVPVLAELEQHDADAQVRVYAGKALKKLRSDAPS